MTNVFPVEIVLDCLHLTGIQFRLLYRSNLPSEQVDCLQEQLDCKCITQFIVEQYSSV